MSHTYIQFYLHCAFGTKNRLPLLKDDLRPRMFAYMGGIIRELGGIPIMINGPRDHVHMLIALPARMSVSDVIRTVKTNSSRWAHELSSEYSDFEWQTGYGAFSLSKSNLDAVTEYIARQEEHHRRKDFKTEYIELLTMHGISFDERYLWD